MLVKFHAHTQHDVIEFGMHFPDHCDPAQALAEAREAVELQPELDMTDAGHITKIELAR